MNPKVNKVRLTVLIALMFSALCAGVFRTPPILFMAALLTSAPFVGVLFSFISSRRLQVSRDLPEIGTVGDIVTGQILLCNRGRWPLFLVHVNCGTGDRRRTERRQAPRDINERRRRGDSKRSNWLALPTKAPLINVPIEPVGGDEQVVPMLSGRSQITWQQQWLLRQRGIHRLAPARAGVLDPLGLSSRLPIKSEAQQIVILPRPVHIEQLGFLSGTGMEQLTPRHSTIVSDAMDFHGVRPWSPGEVIRRAHWKYTARSGQLHVIEWEETPAADLAILLDVHADSIAGDEEVNTLETAITVVATIAAYLLENGCRFQLFYFAPDPANRRAEPEVRLKCVAAHSIEGTDTVLRALAEVEPVRHDEATAVQLAEQALPQVTHGLGALLIASSRATLENVLPRAVPGHLGQLNTFLIDAESFEATDSPAVADRAFDRSTHGAASRMPEMANSESTTDMRFTTAIHKLHPRRRTPQQAPLLRRDDSISAALESNW